jgi:hypothetical protein
MPALRWPENALIALASPRLWAAVFLALVLACSHFFAFRTGKAIVRGQWDAQRVQDEAKARKTEQAWQDTADQTTKAKDDQIRTINRRLNAAIGELRNRPERPAVLPENSGACRSGTGAGLFRDDAEFLSRLAARADAVAAERDACYGVLDQLRAAAGP